MITANFRKQPIYVSMQKCLVPWKFAVISDTQGDRSHERNKSCVKEAAVRVIADDIVREKVDFVLVAGDLVNGWFKNYGIDYAFQYANWKAAMRSVYDAGIRVYPIRGNHDSGPERLVLPPLPSRFEQEPGAPVLLKEAFRNAFDESYIPKNGPVDEEGLTYSFSHKNAFIIGLDQYAGGQHKVNQSWLDRQLAENRNPHIFIYGHEPAFETNQKDNLSFYPKQRDIFWDSIGNAGARIYFCGHDHFYNRALIPDCKGNQIRQIIAGIGGSHLRTWSGAYREDRKVKGEYHNEDHYGYMLVNIEGSKVTARCKGFAKADISPVWKILDLFSYDFIGKTDSGVSYRPGFRGIPCREKNTALPLFRQV